MIRRVVAAVIIQLPVTPGLLPSATDQRIIPYMVPRTHFRTHSACSVRHNLASLLGHLSAEDLPIHGACSSHLWRLERLSDVHRCGLAWLYIHLQRFMRAPCSAGRRSRQELPRKNLSAIPSSRVAAWCRLRLQATRGALVE